MEDKSPPAMPLYKAAGGLYALGYGIFHSSHYRNHRSLRRRAAHGGLRRQKASRRLQCRRAH